MKKKIVVLRGGPSSEHEVSLKSGRSVINELSKQHDVIDVVIDQRGTWISAGREVAPHIVCRTGDVVFNALHGEYGEDGQVQRILETIGIPFTGPRKMAAAVSMNKAKTKEIYKQFGIKTPVHRVIDRATGDIHMQAVEIFRTFPMPVVIKPVSLGSSVGVSIARDFQSLVDTLSSLFIRYDRLLIEEYIPGKEATVAVVDRFRNTPIYSLLPIEIRVPQHKSFFDYEAKYSGITEEICPGNFTSTESALLQQQAAAAHQALGLRHYSRTDFIVHPRRGIFALETNSLPGLTSESLLPKSLPSIGSNYTEFLGHVIELALQNY